MVPINKGSLGKVERNFPEGQIFCHTNQSLLSVPPNNLAEALVPEAAYILDITYNFLFVTVAAPDPNCSIQCDQSSLSRQPDFLSELPRLH